MSLEDAVWLFAERALGLKANDNRLLAKEAALLPRPDFSKEAGPAAAAATALPDATDADSDAGGCSSTNTRALRSWLTAVRPQLLPLVSSKPFLRSCLLQNLTVSKPIAFVEPSFSAFSSLRELSITAGKFNGPFPVHHLPRSLESLNLFSCCITRLELDREGEGSDAAVGPLFPSLIHLGLGYNPLTDLPSSMSTRICPKLQSLDLTCTDLCDTRELISSSLSGLNSLRILRIGGTPAAYSSSFAAMAVSVLPALKQLDDLSLTEETRAAFRKSVGARHVDAAKGEEGSNSVVFHLHLGTMTGLPDLIKLESELLPPSTLLAMFPPPPPEPAAPEPKAAAKGKAPAAAAAPAPAPAPAPPPKPPVVSAVKPAEYRLSIRLHPPSIVSGSPRPRASGSGSGGGSEDPAPVFAVRVPSADGDGAFYYPPLPSQATAAPAAGSGSGSDAPAAAAPPPSSSASVSASVPADSSAAAGLGLVFNSDAAVVLPQPSVELRDALKYRRAKVFLEENKPAPAPVPAAAVEGETPAESTERSHVKPSLTLRFNEGNEDGGHHAANDNAWRVVAVGEMAWERLLELSLDPAAPITLDSELSLQLVASTAEGEGEGGLPRPVAEAVRLLCAEADALKAKWTAAEEEKKAAAAQAAAVPDKKAAAPAKGKGPAVPEPAAAPAVDVGALAAALPSASRIEEVLDGVRDKIAAGGGLRLQVTVRR